MIFFNHVTVIATFLDRYKSVERQLDFHFLTLSCLEPVNRIDQMEVVYVLGNSISLHRKLDAPRTARDEKRRATHNEGMKKR